MAFLVALFLIAITSTTFGLVVEDCGLLDVPRKGSNAIFDGVDTVYIFGGLSTNDTRPDTQILTYSLTNQEVVPFEGIDFTGITLAHGAAVSRGTVAGGNFEIFYIGGGDFNNDYFNSTIYKFTPVPPALTRFGDLPKALAAPTAHLSIETTEAGTFEWIYVLGGENIKSVDTIYRFNPNPINPADIELEQYSSLPYYLTRAASVMIGEQIHIFGGNENSTGFNLHSESIIEFDINGTTSISELRLVDPVESPMAVVGTENRVYVMGGYIGGTYSHQAFTEFNMVGKTFQDICVKDGNKVIPQEGSAIFANNRVIIFGGYTNYTTDAILCIDTNAMDRQACPPEQPPNGAGALSAVAGAVALMLLVSVRESLF